MRLSLPAYLALALIPFAAAHGKITSARGDLGGQGVAFGIEAKQNNQQSDVTRFKDVEKSQGGQNKNRKQKSNDQQDNPFGFLPSSNNKENNPTLQFPQVLALSQNSLPLLSPEGKLTMNLHMQNSDGAGPYGCFVDPTAMGDFSTRMKITTQVPGNGGFFKEFKAENLDFALVAEMPQGVECKGGLGEKTNLCFVRCNNPLGFGGVVPIQMSRQASQQQQQTGEQQQPKSDQEESNNQSQNQNKQGVTQQAKDGVSGQQNQSQQSQPGQQGGEADQQLQKNGDCKERKQNEQQQSSTATTAASEATKTVTIEVVATTYVAARNAGRAVNVRSLLRDF